MRCYFSGPRTVLSFAGSPRNHPRGNLPMLSCNDNIDDDIFDNEFIPAGVTQNRWKELNWLSLKVEVKSMRESRRSLSSNVCPYIINEELCHSNYRFADPKENSFSTANVGMSAIGALRYAGQNIG